ncbi:hypothetical protein Nepgr_003966 [Nepenthes gracilis]|uniref:Uncharacterized protein n=1 Tax=Nepenthes gracilis TaxID=150966 RepID=A0AAD3XEJ1_NEPGR|nr:hypothetical protein Nepgr_003966 [Nepenthes gracilis]
MHSPNRPQVEDPRYFGSYSKHHPFQFQPPASAQQRAAKGHQLKNLGEHAHHEAELQLLPQHLNSTTGPLPINTAIDIHPDSTPALGARATPASCSSCGIKLQP